MPDIVLRAPTPEDIGAVVEVINAEAKRLTGSADVDADAVRGWWTQPPPWDLARDVVVAVRDDAVVGYGDIGDQANDGTVLWLDVRGEEPDALLEELERRASERGAPGAAIRAFADATDEERQAVLRRRGYATMRASYRMGIDLGAGIGGPAWPSGASARTAIAGVDEELLHDLNERSFADHWGYTPTPHEEWLHWLLNMGPPEASLWFIAESYGQPAGVAICRPSRHGDPECGWVSTLGVLRMFRGRGLGTALLLTAFAEFRSRGLRRAGLSVDAESTTGAVRLYQRAGMRIVCQQDAWEKRA